MSKIGTYNLELQEQANELGFSTVQEALDNDYSVVDGQLTYDAIKGLETAHRAWEKEKAKVLKGLHRILDFYKGVDDNHDVIVVADEVSTYELVETTKKAIKFIEEAYE